MYISFLYFTRYFDPSNRDQIYRDKINNFNNRMLNSNSYWDYIMSKIPFYNRDSIIHIAGEKYAKKRRAFYGSGDENDPRIVALLSTDDEN